MINTTFVYGSYLNMLRKIIINDETNVYCQINISALQRGVYFVRLQNEKTVEVTKMVKE